MKRFKNMSEIHKPKILGNFEIKHREFKPTFRELISPEYFGQKEGDIITILTDIRKNEVVMSDSVMEKRTNLDFVYRANGNVLIAGLGIGMIVLAIQDKPEVEKITIVELEQDVINLILPSLPINEKVNVICSDIHDFETDEKFDVVYCDIWNNIDGENYEEMKKLTRKFKSKINRENKESFIGHWRKADCVRLSK